MVTKQPASIVPAVQAIEGIYDRALGELFGIKEKDLTRPVFTIASKGRKSALGWCWPKKWKVADKAHNEVNICAEHLGRGVFGIAETVIHEMVHHVNTERDVDDCKNNYHNKLFKKLAEEVGLTCEQMSGHGWAKTGLTDSLMGTIKKWRIKEGPFELFRHGDDSGPGKQTTRMKKWTCGCTIVRCAVELEAYCEACENPFENEE